MGTAFTTHAACSRNRGIWVGQNASGQVACVRFPPKPLLVPLPAPPPNPHAACCSLAPKPAGAANRMETDDAPSSQRPPPAASPRKYTGAAWDSSKLAWRAWSLRMPGVEPFYLGLYPSDRDAALAVNLFQQQLTRVGGLAEIPSPLDSVPCGISLCEKETARVCRAVERAGLACFNALLAATTQHFVTALLATSPPAIWCQSCGRQLIRSHLAGSSPRTWWCSTPWPPYQTQPGCARVVRQPMASGGLTSQAAHCGGGVTAQRGRVPRCAPGTHLPFPSTSINRRTMGEDEERPVGVALGGVRAFVDRCEGSGKPPVAILSADGTDIPVRLVPTDVGDTQGKLQGNILTLSGLVGASRRERLVGVVYGAPKHIEAPYPAAL